MQVFIILTSLNIFDYVSTQVVLSNGGAELNPLLIPFTSWYAMGLIKVLIIPLLVYFVYANIDKCSMWVTNLIKIVTVIYSFLCCYHVYILLFTI